jgi:hypothetical protein
MATAARSWRSRYFRVAIGCLAPALVTSGCLLSRIGYDNAETLARWTIGDYVDLDPEQRLQLERALRQIHLWHRRVELPIYAAIAFEAARRVEQRLGPADLDWAESVFRMRYDALTGQVARQLADFASSIEPAQTARMKRKFARGNERFRAENVDITAPARTEKRVDEGLELIDDWVGSLERDQERLLAAKLAALPETAEHGYAQRLARQQALLDLVDKRPARDKLIAGVKLWLIGWEAGRSPAHQRIEAEWMRQCRQLVLDLDAMLTRQQRSHVVEKLREHGDDFESWSRKPVSP